MKLSKKALIFKVVLPAILGVSSIAVPLILTIGLKVRMAPLEVSPPPIYYEKKRFLPGLSEIVNAELKKLVPGRILFNPPQEMKVGVKERVEARIAKTLVADLTAGLKGRGIPQIEEIKVGTFMKVRLMGDNFNIQALSHEEQVVAGEGFTQWEWDVTPLKGGMRLLVLAASVRIKLPNYDEETYDHPVFERQIKVRVNPIYTTKKFIEENWQWLIAAIIVPIAGPIIVWIVIEKKRARKRHARREVKQAEL